MADIYVCVNGPQGAGDGSSWANCKSLSGAFASVSAGDTVHIRHHSLNHDGTPSWASAYAQSSALVLSVDGAYDNYISFIGYGPDDQPVRSISDCVIIDFSGLASGDAIKGTSYNWFHGLKIDNAPYRCFNMSYKTAPFFSLCHFANAAAEAVYSSGIGGGAFCCLVEWCGTGLFFQSSGGKVIGCVILGSGDSLGVSLYGYGVIALTYAYQTTINGSMYTSAFFNTVRGLSTAAAFGGMDQGIVAGCIVETSERFVEGASGHRMLLNNLSGTGSFWGYSSIDRHVGHTTYDPGFVDPILPDITHSELVAAAMEYIDVIRGAWQGGSGGGGGGWRPRALRHGF